MRAYQTVREKVDAVAGRVGTDLRDSSDKAAHALEVEMKADAVKADAAGRVYVFRCKSDRVRDEWVSAVRNELMTMAAAPMFFAFWSPVAGP